VKSTWEAKIAELDKWNEISSSRIDTEFHKYPSLEHGFGLGIGTSAEGWIDDAITFWQKQ